MQKRCKKLKVNFNTSYVEERKLVSGIVLLCEEKAKGTVYIVTSVS